MATYPRASIIIPCVVVDGDVEQCVEGCKRLDYTEYEIIVLPDREGRSLPGVRVIPTGSVAPGKKRNIGAKSAGGRILAFIDSDAYPRVDWLRNAVRHLQDPMLGGVGGPGVTPSEDTYPQKAGGKVLSSHMVGALSGRYGEKRKLDSNDIHSCNFVAKREVVEAAGGWNDRYWPGEDTMICMGIKDAGYRMLEAPDVVVYHHRRPLFKQHLKQVSRFGFQRGFFAKRFRGPSVKPTYFAPSLFLTFLILGGLLLMLSPNSYAAITSPLVEEVFESIGIFPLLYTVTIALYLSATLVASLQTGKYAPLVFPGIILTHIVYGVNFIRGYTAKEGLTI